MAKTSSSRRPSQRVPPLLQLGCAHVLLLLIGAGCLLLVNTLAVSFAYQTWQEARTGKRHDPRLAQTILIIAPLALLFVQYCLYDGVRNWLARARDE